MKHLGSLESTQEARVCIFRALQTPRELHISMNARLRMNQWLTFSQVRSRTSVFRGRKILIRAKEK